MLSMLVYFSSAQLAQSRAVAPHASLHVTMKEQKTIHSCWWQLPRLNSHSHALNSHPMADLTPIPMGSQSSPFPCTPLIRTWPNTRTDTGEGCYTSPLTLLICEYRYITLMFLNFFRSTSNQIFFKFPQESMPQAPLIHDLLFLPISTIESGVS